MLGDLEQSHDQQVIMTGHTINRPDAPPLRYESPPECIVLRPGLRGRLVRCEVCDPSPPNYSQPKRIYLHVVVLVTKNHPNGCRWGQLVQRLDAPLGSCHVPIHGLGEVTHIKSRKTQEYIPLPLLVSMLKSPRNSPVRVRLLHTPSVRVAAQRQSGHIPVPTCHNSR